MTMVVVTWWQWKWRGGGNSDSDDDGGNELDDDAFVVDDDVFAVDDGDFDDTDNNIDVGIVNYNDDGIDDDYDDDDADDDGDDDNDCNNNDYRILTLRPASLLCKFINTRPKFLLFFRRRSRASTNFCENAVPNPILSEQPDHSKPSGLRPFTVPSQPQVCRSPLLHARVTECATPAEDIACTNATSRVPGNRETDITIYMDWYFGYFAML